MTEITIIEPPLLKGRRIEFMAAPKGERLF